MLIYVSSVYNKKNKCKKSILTFGNIVDKKGKLKDKLCIKIIVKVSIALIFIIQE